MTYLGMKFKNYKELNEWLKQGKINEYKKLAKIAYNHTTYEVVSTMSEVSFMLHDKFGMSWVEIEALELEALS